jgi:hypothetical protein
MRVDSYCTATLNEVIYPALTNSSNFRNHGFSMDTDEFAAGQSSRCAPTMPPVPDRLRFRSRGGTSNYLEGPMYHATRAVGPPLVKFVVESVVGGDRVTGQDSFQGPFAKS